MSKYENWNEELIKLQFEESKNSEHFLTDFYILEEILSKKINIFPKTNIEDEINTCLYFEDFHEDIKTYSKLHEITKNYSNLYLRDTNITNSLLLSFTHDFYSSLKDKDITKAFQKIFKNRKDNFKFTNERGIELYLPNHQYAYIRSTRNSSIEDITCIVHEYAHAISDAINYHTDIYTYPFIELPSLFFSLISLDKLNEWFIGLAREINNYKKIEVATTTNQAKNIIIFEKIINKYPNIEMNNIKSILKRCFYMKNDEIKYFLASNNIEKYAYVIPYLVVIELYHLYQKDPELALNKLKKIILLNESENYIVDLYDLGINLNEHSKEYVKSLKK